VCVSERDRVCERESLCVKMYIYICVCVCVCVCVRRYKYPAFTAFYGIKFAV
jgi:hypothetical protein